MFILVAMPGFTTLLSGDSENWSGRDTIGATPDLEKSGLSSAPQPDGRAGRTAGG